MKIKASEMIAQMEHYESIVDKLRLYGYTIDGDDDETRVKNNIAYVLEYIFNFCNIRVLPDGLTETFKNMVCGFFISDKLFGKKPIDPEGDLSDLRVKKVQEGDTEVAYDLPKSEETKAEDLISRLCDCDYILKKYRRLCW